jgi:excinuclease ABC subunit B
MQRTIDETSRRRAKQVSYNMENGIIPRTILKSRQDVFASTSVLDIKGYDEKNPYAIASDQDLLVVATEEEAEYQTIPQMEKAISKIKKEMEKAARDLDFMEAARLRDSMFTLQKKLKELKN